MAKGRSKARFVNSMVSKIESDPRLCFRSARVYPLEALMADCRAYFAATGRRVTFEYTLMAGVNDSPQHVRTIASCTAACQTRCPPSKICWHP